MRFLALCAALALAACATAPEPPKSEASQATPGDVRVLAVITSYLQGTHRSIAQDKGPGPGTTVHIAPLWPERQKDGEFWLYVEHTHDGEAQPFRQRIYRFTSVAHKPVIDLFAVPGKPADFAGEWRKPRPFEGYAPAQLTEYPGCTMTTGRMESMFWAHTVGESCRTDDPKVHHERTDMFASFAGMKEGSFGYDAAGRQVAGEAAVWDFRRRAELR